MSNVPLPPIYENHAGKWIDVEDARAHAAAVSAAKDAEIAGLRAELIKSLADNAALRADASDRQNNVVAPLRAEVAGLRDALATESSRKCATEHDCIYQPSCSRIGKCMRPERPFNFAARKGEA